MGGGRGGSGGERLCPQVPGHGIRLLPKRLAPHPLSRRLRPARRPPGAKFRREVLSCPFPVVLAASPASSRPRGGTRRPGPVSPRPLDPARAPAATWLVHSLARSRSSPAWTHRADRHLGACEAGRPQGPHTAVSPEAAPGSGPRWGLEGRTPDTHSAAPTTYAAASPSLSSRNSCPPPAHRVPGETRESGMGGPGVCEGEGEGSPLCVPPTQEPPLHRAPPQLTRGLSKAPGRKEQVTAGAPGLWFSPEQPEAPPSAARSPVRVGLSAFSYFHEGSSGPSPQVWDGGWGEDLGRALPEMALEVEQPPSAAAGPCDVLWPAPEALARPRP